MPDAIGYYFDEFLGPLSSGGVITGDDQLMGGLEPSVALNINLESDILRWQHSSQSADMDFPVTSSTIAGVPDTALGAPVDPWSVWSTIPDASLGVHDAVNTHATYYGTTATTEA